MRFLFQILLRTGGTTIAYAVSLSASAASATLVQNALNLAEAFQANEAIELLESYQSEVLDADPIARYVWAVSLLHAQPRSERNVDQAQRALTDLKANAQNLEIRIASEYWLARIDDLYREHPRATAAAAKYKALWASHPDSLYGQLALVRGFVLSLVESDREGNVDQTLRDARQYLDAITTPEVRKGFYLTLGEGYLKLSKDYEIALEYFLRAAELKIHSARTRAETYITIGQLAELSGRNILAEQYWQLFLQENPRDVRSFYIKRKLERVREEEDR